MFPAYYILDEKGEPKAVRTLSRWAIWFETANRIVQQDHIGPCMVSTVFLGLDHNWSGKGDPILWETLVFNGPCNQEMHRCGGSREQAEAMHTKVLAEVQAEMGVTPKIETKS